MVQGLALALLETMAFNEMVQGSLSVSPIATCATENMNIKRMVTHRFFFMIYRNLRNFETCTDDIYVIYLNFTGF